MALSSPARSLLRSCGHWWMPHGSMKGFHGLEWAFKKKKKHKSDFTNFEA